MSVSKKVNNIIKSSKMKNNGLLTDFGTDAHPNGPRIEQTTSPPSPDNKSMPMEAHRGIESSNRWTF